MTSFLIDWNENKLEVSHRLCYNQDIIRFRKLFMIEYSWSWQGDVAKSVPFNGPAAGWALSWAGSWTGHCFRANLVASMGRRNSLHEPRAYCGDRFGSVKEIAW